MDGSILIEGIDLIAGAGVTLTPGAGQDAAGQLSLDSGAAVFGDDQVIEILFSELSDTGEATGASVVTAVNVYNSLADQQAGTVLYAYTPAIAGDFAPLSLDASAMGDTYFTVDLSGFGAAEVGAPVLTQVFAAPGTDAADNIGTLVLDHHQDVDYNDNGAILAGSIETGNGQFNIAYADFAYNGPTLDYIVEGTDGADYIDDDYGGDPDGDRIDNNDAADRSNDDVIHAGAGDDTIYATEGDDLILGEEGADYARGYLGNDTMEGGIGNDTFYAEEGDDVFRGGEGDDLFQAYDGNDSFEGGRGNDVAHGDRGDDTLHGGEGDDWLRGSFGNDSLTGGLGDDYLWSGYNDDTISLENDFGNDTILMEDQDEISGDVLDLTAITDDLTIDLTHSVHGVGTLSDGTSTATFEAVEHLLLGSGTNTIVLADVSGSDTVTGFDGPIENPDGSFTGQDMLDVSAMTDDSGRPVNTADVRVLDDGDGNAVLAFPGGENITLIGVAPASLSDPAALVAMGVPATAYDGIVEGSENDDVIDQSYVADPDEDQIDNNDAIDPLAGPNDDHVKAGGGNDTIRSAEGNDLLEGQAGNDWLQGEAGNDTLVGGTGDDFMAGGTGNDDLYLGSGDSAFGEDGDDVFQIDEALLDGRDLTLIGGEGDEVNGDTLIIGPNAVVTVDGGDPESGTVTWDDGSTLSFWEIENIKQIPCFTAQSQIMTQRGSIPAEWLRQGDKVLTRDNAFQPVAWVGQRNLSRHELAAKPELRPVLIKAGALGDMSPSQDMLVSPQHRMLLEDPKVNLWFGEREVFVAAIHLTCLDGVEQIDGPVTYVHFMFDRHQVVMADDTWSESFQPGDMSLSGLDKDQRSELSLLFPDLKVETLKLDYPAARPTLNAKEARALLIS